MQRFWLLAMISLTAIGVSAQFFDIPAYHATPPRRGVKLPPILSGLSLSGPSFKYAYQVRGYVLARKIPAVLYQQPCYCRCDRSVGHTSLHSCFESEHGAHCTICLKEVFFAYEMRKQGKKSAEIRQAIERGDWQKVDLEAVRNSN